MKKILLALLLFLAPAMVRGQIINSPAGGSSGPPGTGGFNPTAIYVSPNCQNTPNCFAVNWNTRFDQTCSISNASTSVTCSDAPFTNVDVGKKIAGFNTCNTAAASYSTLIGSSATTIAAVVSSSQITLSLAATGTKATTGCIVYGNPDDAGLASAEALAAVFTSCPVMILPAGIGMITTADFGHTSPATCTASSGIGGATNGPLGYQIQGQGITSTQVFLTPDFNWASCTFGNSGHGCFGYIGLLFRNWGITGGGLGSTPFAGAITIIDPTGSQQQASSVDYFSCINLLGGDTNSSHLGVTGTPAFFLFYPRNSNFDGCGSTNLSLLGATATVRSFNTTYQDSRSQQVFNGGNMFSIDDQYGPSAISVNFASDIVENGGSFHGYFLNIGLNGVLNVQRGITMDGGTVTLVNSSLSYGAGSTSNAGVLFDSGTNSLILLRSSIVGGSANAAIQNVAGTTNTITDLGANSLSTPNFAGGGTNIIAGSASITGVLQTAGNIALTSGWSTSSVGTVSGSSQRMQWTVTVAGTPAASPVITVTFPKAFFVAPLCQYQQEGGTFGVVTNPTITETATTATLTFAGTPVAAQTYVMNLSCSNP